MRISDWSSDVCSSDLWTDYNNHMTESRYLQCFADASDALLRLIGVDADYVAGGGSYFTVETHIRHLDEVAALEPIRVATQVLAAEGKKLRLFHRLTHRSEEHTSELQSLMRISYAVFCLK